MAEQRQRVGFPPESLNSARVMQHAVVQHLQRDRLPGGESRRLIDHAHAATTDAPIDPVAVDVLAAEAIVGRLAQPVGDDVRQEDPDLRMGIRDRVKVSDGEHQRADWRSTDDVGRTGLARQDADFADHVAGVEVADGRRVA